MVRRCERVVSALNVGRRRPCWVCCATTKRMPVLMEQLLPDWMPILPALSLLALTLTTLPGAKQRVPGCCEPGWTNVFAAFAETRLANREPQFRSDALGPSVMTRTLRSESAQVPADYPGAA